MGLSARTVQRVAVEAIRTPHVALPQSTQHRLEPGELLSMLPCDRLILESALAHELHDSCCSVRLAPCASLGTGAAMTRRCTALEVQAGNCGA